MPNYANTIIYKLINYDCPDLLYVGSTTNFIKRKQQHKQTCKTGNTKLYKSIREHGDWDSWVMVKISDYPCTSIAEARMEEDRVMIELKANLNMVRAYTTKQQTKENRQFIKVKAMEYLRRLQETNTTIIS